MSIVLANLNAAGYIIPIYATDARTDFLALLHDPGETFGADYGFTEEDLCQEIEKADSSGVAQHWILDKSQAAGTTESKVLADLLPRLQHSDITLTTAGPLSPEPWQIMHNKVMIVRATDGGEDWCWVGSVNFSESGWKQGNTALRFRSNAFASAFIDGYFLPTRAWAREHIKQPVLQSLVTPAQVSK